MYALLTGDLFSGLVSVLCYMFVSCMLCSLATCYSGLVSVLCYMFVPCMLCSLARPAFGSCKCALLYVCTMYALLTGDLLLGLVSVLCYMFVSCMLCSLATCFRVL